MPLKKLAHIISAFVHMPHRLSVVSKYLRVEWIWRRLGHVPVIIISSLLPVIIISSLLPYVHCCGGVISMSVMLISVI